jgi:hypothetical protein
MRKKTILTVALCMNLAVSSGVTAARTTPAEAGAIEKLGVFLGHWRTTGEMKETPYSKERKKSDDEMTCRWMPNHGFLICDQLIHRPQGTDNELSIYTYNEKDRAYAFFGVGRDEKEARTTQLTIEDNVWTYADESDEAGKRVQFRTINTFVSPTVVTWRAEYSDDGTHWILMGDGKDTRIP